ncbi:MAG TPA: GAF domain-containing protein [Thermomicrobiaceae bacterium]|nr:GAF domain-containing protein [Thermomicrobiaceae bacterium]
MAETRAPSSLASTAGVACVSDVTAVSMPPVPTRPNATPGRAASTRADVVGTLRLAALEAEVQSLRQQASRSALLAALSTNPLPGASDEEVLDAAADALVPALADWCVLYLVRIDGSLEPAGLRHDARGREAVLREVARDRLLDLDAPVPVLRAAGTGEPLLRPAVDPAALDGPNRLRLVGLASAMVIPIQRGRRVVALMLLARVSAGNGYDDEEFAFARQVGDRIGAELDYARLRRETVTSDAHAVARFRVAQAIDRAADTGTMLRDVSQAIAESIGDGCLVRLLDETARVLRLATVAHADPGGLAGCPPPAAIPAGAWLYRQALRNHAPIVLPRLEADRWRLALPRPAAEFAGHTGIHSLALAPLHRAGRPLGLLVLWRDRDGRPYTREDLVQLQELSGWISLAIASSAAVDGAR